jgi:uncharacterized membrane protein YjjB (DUF3815 family)
MLQQIIITITISMILAVVLLHTINNKPSQLPFVIFVGAFQIHCDVAVVHCN